MLFVVTDLLGLTESFLKDYPEKPTDPQGLFDYQEAVALCKAEGKERLLYNYGLPHPLPFAYLDAWYNRSLSKSLPLLVERLTQERDYLSECLARAKENRSSLIREEVAAAVSITALPDTATLEKIQRYEAHLERGIQRILTQLERLQRLRMPDGEKHVLAPQILTVLDSEFTE